MKAACLVTLGIAVLSSSETHPKGLLPEISEYVSPSASRVMVLQIDRAGRNAEPEGSSDGHMSRGQWDKLLVTFIPIQPLLCLTNSAWSLPP